MSGPASVILIHDTVPLDERTQRRELDTQFHTGDVWRLVLCLRAHRPDLDVFTIAAPPTGLTVVSGLNRDSRVLATHYDALVAEFLAVPFDTIAGHLADAVGMVAGDFTAVRARLQRRLRIS
jgi:hypothetical protein